MIYQDHKRCWSQINNGGRKTKNKPIQITTRVQYLLSEECGQDGAAQFVSDFSTSVPLQQ